MHKSHGIARRGGRALFGRGIVGDAGEEVVDLVVVGVFRLDLNGAHVDFIWIIEELERWLLVQIKVQEGALEPGLEAHGEGCLGVAPPGVHVDLRAVFVVEAGVDDIVAALGVFVSYRLDGVRHAKQIIGVVHVVYVQVENRAAAPRRVKVPIPRPAGRAADAMPCSARATRRRCLPVPSDGVSGIRARSGYIAPPSADGWLFLLRRSWRRPR